MGSIEPPARTLPGRAAVVSALALGVVVIVGMFVAFGHRATGGPAGAAPSATYAAGTDMRGHPAPAFSLNDQTGAATSLQSLRGHVVVLTFMDATCTEQCPIMVQYLNWTAQFLGPRATSQIDWVAISVNPNNTPAQATAFLATHQAAIKVHFLLGTQAQLAPLWKAYYIGVEPGQTDVAHSSGLYVIDRQGRELEWVDLPFDAKALGADLKAALGA